MMMIREGRAGSFVCLCVREGERTGEREIIIHVYCNPWGLHACLRGGLRKSGKGGKSERKVALISLTLNSSSIWYLSFALCITL